jgi:chorismate-pyruvate lyase
VATAGSRPDQKVTPAPRKTARRPSARTGASGLLYPLDLACTRAGTAIPQVKVVSPHGIPQPYRSLLVHDAEMTLTLERHFDDRAILRPISTFSSGTFYFRRVLLARASSGRPIAMGAIRIRLDAFSQRLRTKILARQIPLGRILRENRFTYSSKVMAFLSITPTPEIMGIFWMRESRVLYGRRSEIFRDNVKIADVVEVLPLLSRKQR